MSEDEWRGIFRTSQLVDAFVDGTVGCYCEAEAEV
jgi:hypothetical protein